MPQNYAGGRRGPGAVKPSPDPAQAQIQYIAVQPQDADDALQIDVGELMLCLLEKLKYIVAAALAGALVFAAVTLCFITPKYTAVAKLYVLNSKDSALNLSDLQLGAYLANDYMQVFNNHHVHQSVIENLGLDYTNEEIAEMLSVTNPSDTRILKISVESPSPAEAKAIADEYAKVAQEFIEVTMETSQPNIFEVAELPTLRSSPNLTRNVLIGFVLGLVLCALIISIRFFTDDRIKSAEDIKKRMKHSCLGIMPLQGDAPREGAKGRGARR